MNIRNSNRKIFRGYISSRDINGLFYPQNIQNLILRNYCKDKNWNFQMSGTEWIVPKSYTMLRTMINEENDGIIFFSIFQVYENSSKFKEIIDQILTKKKIIVFALEGIEIQNKKELIDLENKLKINKILIKY